MNSAQILRSARDLMNHGGRHWYQRGFFNEKLNDYRYCSAGAIGKMVYNRAEDITLEHNAEAVLAVAALAQEIRPTKKERTHGEALNVIYRWNDAQRRKWPEVRAAFTAAARKVSRKKTA